MEVIENLPPGSNRVYSLSRICGNKHHRSTRSHAGTVRDDQQAQPQPESAGQDRPILVAEWKRSNRLRAARSADKKKHDETFANHRAALQKIKACSTPEQMAQIEQGQDHPQASSTTPGRKGGFKTRLGRAPRRNAAAVLPSSPLRPFGLPCGQATSLRSVRRDRPTCRSDYFGALRPSRRACRTSGIFVVSRRSRCCHRISPGKASPLRPRPACPRYIP